MKPASSYCHIYGQLDQVGNRLGEVLDHLFSLGLVCDASVRFAQATRHRDPLAELHRRGGLIAPNIYPVDCDPACHDPNWWKYSEEECLRLLGLAQKKFAQLDLGPMVAINTYTTGNTLVSACRKMGIRYILGFCAPTVIEDGDWSISQYGSPLAPYFISAEDFRKPENPNGRQDSVMMASMELRNPMTCLNHWSEGPWCPLNALAVDRWLEPTGEPLPFLAIAEDWLRQSESSGTTKFFHINLQYFFAGRCFEHNRRALDWLATQRDRGRLEIGSVQQWAQRIAPQQGYQRQVTYWRGEMMGFHVGHRPGSVADVIVDESIDRQLVWEYPASLPRRWYDYTKAWSYPAFQPDGTAPASETITGVDVQTRLVSESDLAKEVSVDILNEGKSRHLPLALWDLLENCAGPFTVETEAGWTAEVVAHPAGIGAAVLLSGTSAPGKTHVKLTLKIGKKAKNIYKRSWGQLLEAQTFEFQNQTYTVLAAQTPERFAVTVRTTPKVAFPNIRVESLCGLNYEQHVLPSDGLALLFDGTRLACWHRFWGVTADDLQIEGVEETESRLQKVTAAVVSRLAPETKVTAPGYQLFGNIRDESRWDRSLALAAGDAEMKRMNEWFHDLRPGVGEVLMEVHPGIHLPRGSITKVLGHQFDVVRCAEGYEFKELCVDFPQGWDWGVSGWVQWRHLRLSLSGLQGKKGPYVLHLHGFDPEDRNIAQRIHLYNADPALPSAAATPYPVHQKTDLCIVPQWILPSGLEGRWNPTALCSILIPNECLTWPSIGVWINPLEKMHLYDWIAEKGAPGVFSHLWLTKH